MVSRYEKLAHTDPMEVSGSGFVHGDASRVHNLARGGLESKGEVDIAKVLGGKDESNRGDSDSVEDLDDIDIAHLEGTEEGEKLDYPPEGDYPGVHIEIEIVCCDIG